MENYLGLSVAILALIACLFVKLSGFLRLIWSITMICLIVVFTNGFEEDPSLGMIAFTLVGMVAAGFGFSLLPFQFRKYLAYAPGFLALIPIGAKAIYQGFEVVWSLEVASFAIIGSLIPLLAFGLTWVSGKLFKTEDVIVSNGLTLFLFAILAFASVFFVSTFGLLLVAIGYMSTAIGLRSQKGMQQGLVLLSIAWIMFLLGAIEGISDSLLKGNLWMGVLGGVAVVRIATALTQANKSAVLALVFPSLLAVILISFGLVNENFGGMPTLLGVIAGAALASAIQDGKELTGFSPGALISLFFIGLSFSINHVLQPEKLEVETLLDLPKETGNKKVEKKDVLTLPAIPLEVGDAGTWKSIQANSKLEFELGPPANRASGAFKSFDVEMHLNVAGQIKTLQVSMETGSLTTFNSIRDESVLGDDFIKSAKYPKATYTSTSIQKVGENYNIEGILDFVGQKVAVPLQLRFVSKLNKDGKQILVFVGKSVVDRTKHTMSSDPKIGDLVDVVFEVAMER